MLGLSDRNMGRNRMKSSPSGLCFPLGVMGRQCTQEGFTTGKQYQEYIHPFNPQDRRHIQIWFETKLWTENKWINKWPESCTIRFCHKKDLIKILEQRITTLSTGRLKEDRCKTMLVFIINVFIKCCSNMAVLKFLVTAYLSWNCMCF